MMRFLGIGLFVLLPLLVAIPTRAADSSAVAPDVIDAIKGLKTADATGRQAVYDLIAKKGDARLVPALKAYRDGLLQLRDGRLILYGARTDVPGKGSVLPVLDAITAQPITDTGGQPEYIEKPDLSHAIKSPPFRERRVINDLISALSLNDPDTTRHRDAIRAAGDRSDDSLLAALQLQLANNPQSPFASDLKESMARLQLASGSKDEKISAAQALADIHTTRSISSMEHARSLPVNQSNSKLLGILDRGIQSGESYQSRISFIQDTFAGASAGSILILLALGLSIIFGLMGVINMAHGEFMMVGAFTTFVVSEWFRAHCPAWFDYYLLAAIPAAFLVAGLVGWLCEWAVIRHLYGRPLETLLATWGVGLILIQAARVWFGNNQSVKPPSWMEGGIEVAPDLIFALNRVYIIVFCALCIFVVYFLVNRTKLGLLLRATTQNREMAAALGVATRRIDAMTFAFGAGLAGLAGVAVPLYNKINPSIGQEYIVDSFMVVVVGGVGKLAGSIVAGLGLGFTGKYLEALLEKIPFLASGASVIGKVVVLGLIVVFLQWKPSGLFPPKGRMADS